MSATRIGRGGTQIDADLLAAFSQIAKMTQTRLNETNKTFASWSPGVSIWIYPIVLLGAALRFYQLGHFSLWDGEIFTLFISQKELSLILPALRDFGAHPPIWFFITRAFDAFGWNEWMLRAPSALVGILAIPAMYVVGKRCANAAVGLIAALLLAIAPLAVLYAQVGRMYSVIIPLAALMLYAMLRALQTKQWRWWFALALLSALTVYNQYLSLLAVGSAYLLVGSALVLQTWQAVHAVHIGELVREFFKRTARMWVSFGAFFILLAPLLPLMSKNFFQRQLGREALSTFNPVTVNSEFLRALFADLAGNEWLLVLSGLLILAGLILSLRKRDVRSLLLLVTWFGLVFVVVTVIHPRRFPSRYVLHLVPVYILLTAHGIALTSEWGAQLFRRASASAMLKPQWLTGILTALLAILALVELSGMYRGTQEISRGEKTTALLLNGNWRELAQYLNQNIAPGDFVVYGGDGPIRPPRFIAPYVPADYPARSHTLNTASSKPTNVWWVGVNLQAQDIFNPTPSQVTPLQSFGDTDVARTTRQISWTPIPLPSKLDEWQVTTLKPGITFTEESSANKNAAPILRATFSAAVDADLFSPTVPVRAGELFRVSARVRGVSEGFYDFSPALNLQFFDDKKKNVTDNGAQTLLGADADGWHTLVLDGVVPQGATSGRLALVWSDYSFHYAPNVELTDAQWWLEQAPQ